MRYIALLIATTTACSQQVYSPPSQTFSVHPLSSLPEGRQALDVEVSRHAQIFDPSIDTGAARLRTGIGDNTEIAVEGTVLGVDDHGPSRASRSLYTGRVGLSTTPGAGGHSIFAGLGGGYAPAGGTFAAADAGIAVGYHNCTLVPVLQGSGFVSVPLAARPVDVTTDDAEMTFDTPRRTAGGVVRGGLRLSLAPSACRRGEQASWVNAGIGFTHLSDGEHSATLIGVGVGIEIPL